jgi:hypothetical protein
MTAEPSPLWWSRDARRPGLATQMILAGGLQADRRSLYGPQSLPWAVSERRHAVMGAIASSSQKFGIWSGTQQEEES